MTHILKALESPLKVVREENTGSARLRTTSSRGSWNTYIFGSWRQSLDVGAAPASSATAQVEGLESLKRSATSGSQGSGQIVGGAEHSSLQRQKSREIFREPTDVHDIERQRED